MDTFLRQVGGFIKKDHKPHPSFTSSVSRFARYHKMHLTISLSQAGERGLMNVVACSSNATADMTAGGVATFYLGFTLCGTNIRRESWK